MKLDLFRTLKIKTKMWLEDFFASMFYLDGTQVSSLAFMVGKSMRILELALIKGVQLILFSVSHNLGYILII